MTRRYLALAALLALAAVSYMFFVGEEVLPIFLVVATLFAAHFAFDEFHLAGEPMNLRKRATALLFVLVFVTMMLAMAFPGVTFFLPIAYATAIVFASWVVAQLLHRRSASTAERYLFFVAAILMTLGFGFGLLEQVLAVVILLHCANWMLGYGARVASDPTRRARYWRESALTLGGSIALYAAFRLLDVDALRYFFLLAYYDAWAIGHIILSLRLPQKV